MTGRIQLAATFAVITAVLVLLLHPATPGVICPTGSKSPVLTLALALNVFSSWIMFRLTPMSPRAIVTETITDAPGSPSRLNTLLC